MSTLQRTLTKNGFLKTVSYLERWIETAHSPSYPAGPVVLPRIDGLSELLPSPHDRQVLRTHSHQLSKIRTPEMQRVLKRAMDTLMSKATAKELRVFNNKQTLGEKAYDLFKPNEQGFSRFVKADRLVRNGLPLGNGCAWGRGDTLKAYGRRYRLQKQRNGTSTKNKIIAMRMVGLA